MWQKCPVCNGSGASQFALYMTSGLCSTCHGHGIINELTGAPMPDPVSIDPPKFTKISDEQRQREIADILKRTNDLCPKKSLNETDMITRLIDDTPNMSMGFNVPKSKK